MPALPDHNLILCADKNIGALRDLEVTLDSMLSLNEEFDMNIHCLRQIIEELEKIALKCKYEAQIRDITKALDQLSS